MVQRKSKQEEREKEGNDQKSEGYDMTPDKRHQKRKNQKNQKKAMKAVIAITNNTRQQHHHHVSVVVEESSEDLAKLDLPQSDTEVQSPTSTSSNQRRRLKLAPRTKPIPQLDIDLHYVSEIHTTVSADSESKSHQTQSRSIDDDGDGTTIIVQKILIRPTKRDRGHEGKLHTARDDEKCEDTNLNMEKLAIALKHKEPGMHINVDCSRDQHTPMPYDINTDEESKDFSVGSSFVSDKSSSQGRGNTGGRGGGRGRATGRGRSGRGRGRGGRGKSGSRKHTKSDDEHSLTSSGERSQRSKKEKSRSTNKEKYQPLFAEEQSEGRPPKTGFSLTNQNTSLDAMSVNKSAKAEQKHSSSPFAFTIGENAGHQSNSSRIKVKDKINAELLPNGTVRLSRSRSNISKGSESSGGYSISSRTSGRGRGRGRGNGRGRGKSQGRGRGGRGSHTKETPNKLPDEQDN